MIILGPSFSGKNNLVFYILKNSPNVFSRLHIIARNPNQELYNYINVDNIRKNKDDPIELVIFYDYSNDQVLQNALFSRYFTRGRHFKLSTIFLSIPTLPLVR
ncbi:TPA: hypothetical protein N0F65_001880 [Lagenidium giganteum]|uniref:Uncharacterized protein n=1 Tax=Lagenidium giganteum TaxID=4803 RepID=A0AAV2Z245_9STRA|nr:TPA: hypothetical protein N0F65_001880 [Lagenidium giganteum]